MSKRKPSAKPRPGSRSRPTGPSPSSLPATVSARWLLAGIAAALAAALVCAWGTLCILFWQGSWQLLYHPRSAVQQTPARVNLAFESVGFSTTESGEPRLRGWWIPAASSPRFTVLYLHGGSGNIADTVDSLVPLHAERLNVLAFDYRGYGQSRFLHPSEMHWREDAEAALTYLLNTRHIRASSIIVDGYDLGANLAVEVAAAHPDLAGVILEQPLNSPLAAVLDDQRASIVPARLLFRDHWDTAKDASNILIPSLWFFRDTAGSAAKRPENPLDYRNVPARKMLVWLSDPPAEAAQLSRAVSEWLDELPGPGL